MRIVVTGVNGLVGSRLARLLASRGHQVIGLGRGERRAKGDFAYATVELQDAEPVQRALDVAQPDVVINPASMTEVDACEKQPEAAFGANVLAVAHLAQWTRANDSHLIHVSTDYVFDGDHGPYAETALPNPRGVYAITKHMGEQAVRTLAGPQAAICRTAVVYGWPQAARPNFGAWLVQTLAAGKEVKLFEDQFVSPSLADNVAAMLAELAVKKAVGVWNTSGATVLNRVDFGRALCRVFGFDEKLLVPTRLAELKLASPRPLHSGLKVDKALAELEAKPLALEDSLRQFHQAYQAAQQGAAS